MCVSVSIISYSSFTANPFLCSMYTQEESCHVQCRRRIPIFLIPFRPHLTTRTRSASEPAAKPFQGRYVHLQDRSFLLFCLPQRFCLNKSCYSQDAAISYLYHYASTIVNSMY